MDFLGVTVFSPTRLLSLSLSFSLSPFSLSLSLSPRAPPSLSLSLSPPLSLSSSSPPLSLFPPSLSPLSQFLFSLYLPFLRSLLSPRPPPSRLSLSIFFLFFFTVSVHWHRRLQWTFFDVSKIHAVVFQAHVGVFDVRVLGVWVYDELEYTATVLNHHSRRRHRLLKCYHPSFHTGGFSIYLCDHPANNKTHIINKQHSRTAKLISLPSWLSTEVRGLGCS